MLKNDDILNRLNMFYDDKGANVALIQGEWGTGKTYIVNDWIKRFDDNKNIKIVYLSLFGMSTVDELNSQLLENTYLTNKIEKKTKKMKVEASATMNNGYESYSYGLSLSGLFSLLAKDEYKENKKKQFIIIIDDIERKDNSLSLVQVFGFVDSLKLQNTKIILVSNSKIFKDNDDEQFKFKEKIVDYEINIVKPTIDAINAIVPKKISNNLDVSEVKNLRVLKSFVKLYNLYGKADTDSCVLNIILSILMQMKTDTYSRSSFIKMKLSEELRFEKLYNINNDKNIDENTVADKINKKYSETIYSEPTILFEYLKENKKYSKIDENELRRGIDNIYKLIKLEDFEEVFNYAIKYLDYERKVLNLNVEEIFYNINPSKMITSLLNQIIKIRYDEGYDYIDIYKKMRAILSYHDNEIYYLERNEKLLRIISNFLPAKIANQIYESRLYYREYFDSFMMYNGKYMIDMNSKIMKEIEKIYIHNLNTLLKNDSFIASFGDEISRINSIMSDTKCSFDKNLKQEIYKKLLKKAIKLSSKDVLNTWSNIHDLFRNISHDSDLNKDDLIAFINNNLNENKKIQYYRVTALIKQYLGK